MTKNENDKYMPFIINMLSKQLHFVPKSPHSDMNQAPL